MNKTSEAQLKANKKYSEKFERINVRFPLGIREQIAQTGAKSANAFIIQAVQEKLTQQLDSHKPHNVEAEQTPHSSVASHDFEEPYIEKTKNYDECIELHFQALQDI